MMQVYTPDWLLRMPKTWRVLLFDTTLPRGSTQDTDVMVTEAFPTREHDTCKVDFSTT